MPVCGRGQRTLKKLPGTTSFEPRQTLLAKMRERESVFLLKFDARHLA